MSMDAQDIALEVVWQAVNYADYRQTRVISENPDLWFERNPFLGEHPSTSRVKNYFIGGALAHAAITAILPAGKYRTIWQGATITIAAGFVYYNHSIGIRW